MTRALCACLLACALSACANTGTNAVREDASVSTSLAGAYLASRYAAFQGDGGTARGFLAEALRRAPNDPDLLATAFAFALREGDAEAAATAARRLSIQRELSDQESLVLAIDAFRRGRFQDALALSERSFAGFDGFAGDLLVAWSHFARNDRDDALAALDEAENLKLLPDVQAMAEGLIRQADGDMSGARLAYERAAAGDERDFTTVDVFGRFLESQGEVDEARRLYERALAVQPAHPAAIRGLRRIESGRRSNRPYPVDAQRGFAIGLQKLALRLAARRFAIGAVYAGFAASVDPSYGESWSLLGEIRSLRGDHGAAAAAFARVPDRALAGADARLAQSRALFEDGRTKEALAVLETTSTARTDPRIGLQRAQLLHRDGQWQEAHAAYTRRLSAFEDDDATRGQVLYARANLRIQMERWSGAEKDLRRALVFRPDDPRVLNDLGYVLIERGDRRDMVREGLGFAQRALDQEPANGAYLDTVGWGYFRLGRYEVAVAHLERAVAADPDSALLLDHLGDAYWRAGRRREARHQWSHALALEPSESFSALLRAKIAEGLDETTQATDVAEALDGTTP